MEGRTEDKRGGEIKTRMSHGHTQWANVPRKALHTQKHEPTLHRSHIHTLAPSSTELHLARDAEKKRWMCTCLRIEVMRRETEVKTTVGGCGGGG